MNTIPIPKGYDALIPALVIKGAVEAIEWYKEVFGAVETFRMAYPQNPRLLAHAELTIRGHVLMLSDESPDQGCRSPLGLNAPSPVTIMIYVPDVDAQYGKAISLGAKPIMPPVDMFWGDRFSKFTDPYGHVWAVATHIKDVSPEELARGAAKAFEGQKG